MKKDGKGKGKGKAYEMSKRTFKVMGLDEYGMLFAEVIKAKDSFEAERKVAKRGLWGRKVKQIYGAEEIR